MTINVLFDQNDNIELDTASIKHAIQLSLDEHGASDADITLKLTDDAEVRQLNHTYRGINKTTDVLSFNQDYIDPETGRLYLGDIIISVDQAVTQASENNVTLNEECVLLAIHGTLHLLGYDHAEPKDKDAMWERQERLFSKAMKPGSEDKK